MRRFVLLVGLCIAPVVVVLVVVVGLSIAGATAWTRYTHPGASYDNAPDVMPVLRALERERVTFLRTQDWCQAYNDGDGVHANTVQGTCTVTAGAADTFDASTRARYEKLADLTAEMPYRMNYVEITYDAGGRMTGAQISLAKAFSRQSLVYEPGYSLEALRSGIMVDVTTYTPIDANWYHMLEDSN
jgi:hypothetical protein